MRHREDIDQQILSKAKALDAIRFIAAMCVVLFHYNCFTGTAHSDEAFPFFGLLKFAYIYGGSWVEFFFILSGFSFFAVYENRIRVKDISAKEFIIRRFSRLFPLYYFSSIITRITVVLSLRYLGTALPGGAYFDSSIKSLIVNILGIGKGWIDNRTHLYNKPAWTISVEIFCYILFFLICSFIEEPKYRLAICAGLTVAGVLVFGSGFQYPILNRSMARGVSCFFMEGYYVTFSGGLKRRVISFIYL